MLLGAGERLVTGVVLAAGMVVEGFAIGAGAADDMPMGCPANIASIIVASLV